MTQVLTYGGVMQFRNGKVQIVPAGGDPADCVCCDGGVCSITCGDGVPYNITSVTLTFSVPDSVSVWGPESFSSSASKYVRQRVTWSGYSSYSGTYVIPLDGLCIPSIPDPGVTLTYNQVLVETDTPFPGPPPPPGGGCPTNTTVGTATTGTVPGRISFSLVGSDTSIPWAIVPNGPPASIQWGGAIQWTQDASSPGVPICQSETRTDGVPAGVPANYFRQVLDPNNSPNFCASTPAQGPWSSTISYAGGP